MPAYAIVEVEIEDPEKYEEYKKLVPPLLEKYGARYLARGGRVETLEGDWKPGRLVVVEFPSLERAREWWASEEYRPAKRMRQEASRTRMVVVEGLPG